MSGVITKGGTKPSISASTDRSPFSQVKISSEAMKERVSQLYTVFRRRDQKYGRFMIVADTKGGKTHAAVYTLPTPVLFLIFDPNCEAVISDKMLDSGLILPVRYYDDDPRKPTGYAQYQKDIDAWLKDGFFETFASVCIDSFSNLQASQLRQTINTDLTEMNKLRSSGKQRVLPTPQIQDYATTKLDSITTFVQLASVPCHLVLNAHVLEERKGQTLENPQGNLQRGLNANPALVAAIPGLFSELYYAERLTTKPKNPNDDLIYEYVWTTTKTNRCPGLEFGSLMRQKDNKRIPDEVPQDFRALLKACDFHWEDKPPLI